MSTIYHTPITAVPNQLADAALWNSRFSSLDTGIDDAMSFGVNNNAELAAARSPYASLDARLDAITFGYVGGNIATLTNGAASAGQKNVTVDSTDGFLVGAYVAYERPDGTVEYNTIASITPTTTLVMTTNIGTGGIADNSYIGMISVSEYQAANAIPHDDPLTLPEAIQYSNSDKFHVGAYGAWPGANPAQNTAGINAAIAAAKAAGGTVVGRLGKYVYDGAINLCDCQNITLKGSVAGQPGRTSGTIFECRNTGGAAIEIIGSANIELRDLQIIGHATDTPAVGIWTGRSDAVGGNNTSQIRIQRVQVYGAFSTAMLLNTGCESVQLLHCYVYPTSTACKAGWMFDWQNSIGLTPEHTGLSLDYPSTLCVLDRSFIVSGGDTGFESYSPIYVVAEDGPSIRLSYLNAWGAPTIYLKGGAAAWAIDIEDSFSEGNPTYLIHCDYWDGTTGDDPHCGEVPGAYCSGNIFRLKLRNFGGSAGSSGYSIYAEDDTTLRETIVESCGFRGNLRFYNVEGSRFERWGNFDGAINPTLTVAGYAANSYFHVNYADSISIVGNMVNVTVDHEGAADSPGAGYLLLAGNKGLSIGGAPGAAQQAVTRMVRTAASASPWAPGTLADGAAASTYVMVTDVDDDGTWFCKASYPGTGGSTANILLSAWAANGAVVVSLLNKTGGNITPSGTVYVVAEKIVET